MFSPNASSYDYRNIFIDWNDQVDPERLIRERLALSYIAPVIMHLQFTQWHRFLELLENKPYQITHEDFIKLILSLRRLTTNATFKGESCRYYLLLYLIQAIYIHEIKNTRNQIRSEFLKSNKQLESLVIKEKHQLQNNLRDEERRYNQITQMIPQTDEAITTSLHPIHPILREDFRKNINEVIRLAQEEAQDDPRWMLAKFLSRCNLNTFFSKTTDKEEDHQLKRVALHLLKHSISKWRDYTNTNLPEIFNNCISTNTSRHSTCIELSRKGKDLDREISTFHASFSNRSKDDKHFYERKEALLSFIESLAELHKTIRNELSAHYKKFSIRAASEIILNSLQTNNKLSHIADLYFKIKKFPDNIADLQDFMSLEGLDNLIAEELQSSVKSKEDKALIVIAEKTGLINKLLNALSFYSSLESSYYDAPHANSENLCLTLIKKLITIEPYVNSHGSYCLTSKMLSNLVLRLTTLRLNQVALLELGCDIISSIAANYDSQFVFDHLVNSDNLKTFFSNLLKTCLAHVNLEEPGNLEEPDTGYYSTQRSFCRAVMELESVAQREHASHENDKYTKDFTRVYMIILMIPFAEEITNPYSNDDNLTTQKMWDLLNNSGIYKNHTNYDLMQYITSHASTFIFFPKRSLDLKYTLLRGTVKILYVLATVWNNEWVNGSEISKIEVNTVLSVIERLSNLLKYYAYRGASLKEAYKVLLDIENKSQSSESLIGIIKYSLKLIIGMTEAGILNPENSISSIKKLLENIKITLEYSHIQSVNPSTISERNTIPYNVQFCSLMLDFRTISIPNLSDPMLESYYDPTDYRKLFIFFLIEILTSHSRTPHFNYDIIFGLNITSALNQDKSTNGYSQPLHAILVNKILLGKINSYISPSCEQNNGPDATFNVLFRNKQHLIDFSKVICEILNPKSGASKTSTEEINKALKFCDILISYINGFSGSPEQQVALQCYNAISNIIKIAFEKIKDKLYKKLYPSEKQSIANKHKLMQILQEYTSDTSELEDTCRQTIIGMIDDKPQTNVGDPYALGQIIDTSVSAVCTKTLSDVMSAIKIPTITGAEHTSTFLQNTPDKTVTDASSDSPDEAITIAPSGQW